MPEIGTSGLMSGERKRSVAAWPKLPRLSSTLLHPSNRTPAHRSLLRVWKTWRRAAFIKRIARYSMRERIFLTYTNATALPYHGAVVAHHVVLNYIDANDKHYTLEGVPERKFNHNVEKMIAFSLEEGRPG